MSALAAAVVKPAVTPILGPSSSVKVVRKWHQIGASFCACLTSASTGHCFSMSSFLVPQLEDPDSSIHITSEEGSWLASLLLIGGLLGALGGGLQSDRFGRRISLMIDNIILLSSFALIAAAPNFPLILLGRFLSGYAAASCTVTTPIYVSEISQPGIRGLTTSFLMICYNGGYGIMMLLGALFPWRVAIGVCCITSLTSLVGLKLVCPETPVWLVRRGREGEALEALTYLRGEEEVEIIKAEFGGLRDMLRGKQQREEMSWLGRCRETFGSASFVKSFLIVLALVTVGMELSGLPVIVFYLVSILQDADLPFSPYWGAASLAMYRSALAILTSGIVLKCRRRRVLFATGTLISIASMILATHAYLKARNLTDGHPWTDWIPLVAAAMFFTGSSSGYMTTIYGLQGELLPAEARSLGCGIVGFADNIVMFLVTKSVPAATETVGTEGVFFTFSGCVAVMLVVMYFVMPETHGLSLEEIEERLKKKERRPVVEGAV